MNIKGFQIVGTAFRLLLVITVRYIYYSAFEDMLIDPVDFLVFAIVLCPNLTDPVDGRVHLSGVAVGDTASFICASGYELIGHPLLTCLSDGDWDSSPPICQSMTKQAYYLLLLIIMSGIIISL